MPTQYPHLQNNGFLFSPGQKDNFFPKALGNVSKIKRRLNPLRNPFKKSGLSAADKTYLTSNFFPVTHVLTNFRHINKSMDKLFLQKSLNGKDITTKYCIHLSQLLCTETLKRLSFARWYLYAFLLYFSGKRIIAKSRQNQLFYLALGTRSFQNKVK